MVMGHHVTLKGQTRDPNTLRAQYLKNSWRCYLATIANHCCEAVQSAFLATAWLLVIFILRPVHYTENNHCDHPFALNLPPTVTDAYINKGGSFDAKFGEEGSDRFEPNCNTLCLKKRPSFKTV